MIVPKMRADRVPPFGPARGGCFSNADAHGMHRTHTACVRTSIMMHSMHRTLALHKAAKAGRLFQMGF
jgi:hypothetical protein